MWGATLILADDSNDRVLSLTPRTRRAGPYMLKLVYYACMCAGTGAGLPRQCRVDRHYGLTGGAGDRPSVRWEPARGPADGGHLSKPCCSWKTQCNRSQSGSRVQLTRAATVSKLLSIENVIMTAATACSFGTYLCVAEHAGRDANPSASLQSGCGAVRILVDATRLPRAAGAHAYVVIVSYRKVHKRRPPRRR